jgi:hypothetical protein
MNKSPITLDTWLTGLTLEDYVAEMKMNQSHMARRLASVQLTPAEQGGFARYHSRMHVLVMTEDWCGDAWMNLPIVARIVESLPDADLRVFVRTTAVELNAYYIGRDVTKIPVITFFSQDFRELGTWVERPRTADAWRTAWMAAHPDFVQGKSPVQLSPEERQRRMRQLMDLMAEMEVQYDAGIYSDTVTEIRALLDKAVTA